MVPVPEADPGPAMLRRLVTSVQKALCRRTATVATLWALAAVMAPVAGFLAADMLLPLPGIVRLAAYGLVVLCGFAAAVVAARSWFHLPALLYVARLIEQRRPELKNALTTFIELEGDPSADRSQAVAVGRRAARVLARDVPATFAEPVPVRGAVLAVAGAAALLTAALWTSSASQVTLLATAEAGVAPRREAGASPRAAASPETIPPARAKGPDLGAPPAHSARVRPETSQAEASPDKRGVSPSASAGTASAAEQAAADALAPSLEADAGMFERLAAALGAAGEGEPTGAGGPRGDGTGNAQGTDDPDARQATHPSGDTGTGRQDAASNDASATDAPPAAKATGDQGTTPSGHDSAAGTETTGNHSQGTGGGAAENPPRQAAGDPPLPERNPGDAFPESALDAMRRARRLIGKAERRLRDGEVDDAFLGRMGVGNADFRRFITAWDRKLDGVSRGPDVTARPDEVRIVPGTEPGEVIRPGQGTDARPIVGRLDLQADGHGGWVQGAESRVSPRLRPAVEAYFETVGRLTGRRAQEKPDG